MDNWLKYLVGISAIVIAGCAAFFSITGLGILFAGASISVMVMAASLEYAKLVTATYLKQKWDTIKGFNKWYLTASVIILMVITSAGIFGYLSNAFQQQNIKLDQVAREIQVWQNKIDYGNQQIETLQSQSKDLTSTQNTLLSRGNVNSRLIRSADNRDKQSTAISKKINIIQDSIVAYNGHINDIKNANIDIEREVGGFRFVADAFGMTLNNVVKFFIFLIVIVFDPLAIALVIAFNQLVMAKKEEEEIQPSNPEDLKNFVDETVRLRLSEDDLKKLEEALLNPKKPNEELKKAAEEYNKKMDTNVSDWDVTLMDGLEDEEPFFTEEEIEKILQEEPTEEEIQRNFSTITSETENIFHKEEEIKIDEDNERMDIIGQNGNEGLHYENEPLPPPSPLLKPKLQEHKPKFVEYVAPNTSENDEEKKNL
jgi:hypothetical protein